LASLGVLGGLSLFNREERPSGQAKNRKERKGFLFIIFSWRRLAPSAVSSLFNREERPSGQAKNRKERKVFY